VKVLVLLSKVGLVISFIMVIRWTIPRFRFDQLMGLAWKVLIPLALVNLVLVMIAKEFRLSLWWLLPASIAALVGAGVIAAAPRTERAGIRA
jgi:NADH-quinone oxidoreductase subunit H